MQVGVIKKALARYKGMVDLLNQDPGLAQEAARRGYLKWF